MLSLIEFRDQFIKFLDKQYPDSFNIETFKDCDGKIIIHMDEHSALETNLDNAYDELRSNEDNTKSYKRKIEEMFAAVSRPIIEQKKLRAMLQNYDSARRILFPKISRERELSDSSTTLFSDNFAAGLKVYYVLETESSFAFLSDKTIEGWKLTGDELRKVAYDNLRKRTDRPFKRVSADDLYFYVANYKDEFNATRILLNERLKEVLVKENVEMMAVIPDRDSLIVFPRKFQRMFAERALERFKNTSYPLTAEIFDISHDGKASINAASMLLRR